MKTISGLLFGRVKSRQTIPLATSTELMNFLAASDTGGTPNLISVGTAFTALTLTGATFAGDAFTGGTAASLRETAL